MERPRIVFIGSGNVATHLAKAFDAVAHVVQVCSRDIEHAKCLSGSLTDCIPIDDLNNLIDDADLYVIAVSDDAISAIAQQMPRTHGVVVHTSGSTPIDAISGVSPSYGVMYPLQTFSATAQVDVSDVPFFNESNNAETLKDIDHYASMISRNVHHADSEQRQTLHIAAVFACNFTNHLLGISDHLLSGEGYSLDVLRPLLKVTIDKAFDLSPDLSQTGPARRGDTGVMTRHIAALPPHLSEIYRLLSASIMRNYDKTWSDNG